MKAFLEAMLLYKHKLLYDTYMNKPGLYIVFLKCIKDYIMC